MIIFFTTLFSLLCLFVAPFFLMEQRRKVSFRSLILKMICASMFLMVGLLAFHHSDGSGFSKYMAIGLALSWVGDLFLHLPGLQQILGFIGFFGAHIAYLAAYYDELKTIQPDSRLITPLVIFFIIVGMLAYLLVFHATKTKLSPLMIPLTFYVFLLMLMCCNALRLAGLSFSQTMPGAICLSLGAIFFLLSDTSLGILMFNQELKKNFPLKVFNIMTYFVGQLLLAYTIFFF